MMSLARHWFFSLLAVAAAEDLVAFDFAGRGSASAVADVLSRVLHLTQEEVSSNFDLETGDRMPSSTAKGSQDRSML